MVPQEGNGDFEWEVLDVESVVVYGVQDSVPGQFDNLWEDVFLIVIGMVVVDVDMIDVVAVEKKLVDNSADVAVDIDVVHIVVAVEEVVETGVDTDHSDVDYYCDLDHQIVGNIAVNQEDILDMN